MASGPTPIEPKLTICMEWEQTACEQFFFLEKLLNVDDTREQIQ